MFPLIGKNNIIVNVQHLETRGNIYYYKSINYCWNIAKIADFSYRFLFGHFECGAVYKVANILEFDRYSKMNIY